MSTEASRVQGGSGAEVIALAIIGNDARVLRNKIGAMWGSMQRGAHRWERWINGSRAGEGSPGRCWGTRKKETTKTVVGVKER